MQRLINFEGTPAVFHDPLMRDQLFGAQPTTPTQLPDHNSVSLIPNERTPAPPTAWADEPLPRTVEYIIDKVMAYVERARDALTRNLLAPPVEMTP